MNAFRCLVLAVTTGTAAVPAVAQEARIDPAVLTEGFLAAHPDLRWRAEGVRSYEKKDYAVALAEFRRAAYYGDKPAQAMIAEMYWNGIGVATDRSLAYAWMDIAAERLYHDFLVRREGIWSALDAAEQQDALSRGQALMAEYGDDAAKPEVGEDPSSRAAPGNGKSGWFRRQSHHRPVHGSAGGHGDDVDRRGVLRAPVLATRKVLAAAGYDLESAAQGAGQGG